MAGTDGTRDAALMDDNGHSSTDTNEDLFCTPPTHSGGGGMIMYMSGKKEGRDRSRRGR
jgi:hypothetical protein